MQSIEHIQPKKNHRKSVTLILAMLTSCYDSHFECSNTSVSENKLDGIDCCDCSV